MHKVFECYIGFALFFSTVVSVGMGGDKHGGLFWEWSGALARDLQIPTVAFVETHAVRLDASWMVSLFFLFRTMVVRTAWQWLRLPSHPISHLRDDPRFPFLVFPFVSHTRLGFPGFSDGFSRTDQSTPQQDGSSHKHSQTSCWTVHRIAMSTSTRAPRASAPPKRFSPSDGAGGAAGTVQVRGRRCGSHGKRWRTRADGTRTDR